MIGKIKLNGKSGSNINGIIQTYTAGNDIKAGNFVKLKDNTIQNVTSLNDTIHGIAKSNAKSGQQVKVIIPNKEGN